MSRRILTAIGLVLAVIGVRAEAQTVAMYGEYHGTSGIIVNIPQNPPTVGCVPPPLTVLPPPHATVGGAMTFQHLDLRPTGVNDARCHDREQHINFTTMAPGVFNQPAVGNHGAQLANAGLAVGDPFTIPPFAFEQQLGPQVGIVLQNVTRQLDTTFIAAMPGIDRIGPNPGAGGSYTVKTPMQLLPAPALTRMFSQMNWQNPGNGQNNGKPGPSFAARLAADTTVINSAAGGNEQIEVRYRSGPRQFGGTMAMLLDGRGRLNLGGPPITGMLPASFKPGAATQPLGDNVPGFRARDGGGWNLSVPGGQQPPGRVKAFFAGFNPANALTPMGDPRVAPDCIGNNPPSPPGCNEINGFDTFMAGPFTTMTLMIPAGGTIGALPKATSVKFQFALTTGTVSIVRVALRNGIHFSDTVTGMGYDTLGLSQNGGPQRNVGLVAGGYSIRTDAAGGTQLAAQMLGLNLKFAPEPASTGALVAGLSLIGLLAHRHRRRS